MVSKKKVQLKIECSHEAIVKENSSHFMTHDWTVVVKGTDGADISRVLDKVVFNLHASFVEPKRTCQDPPYMVKEDGYGSFTLPIDIYFKTSTNGDIRRRRINYNLSLQMVGLPTLNCTTMKAFTFVNPSEEFEKRLLDAGAVILPSE